MREPRDRIKPALRFIRIHFRQPLSMRQIAAAAGLTPAYFGQVFAKAVGRTALDVLNEMRVAAAIGELMEGDTGIGRIAASVGFKQRRHFGRVFKQMMGLPPRQYRQRHSSAKGVVAAKAPPLTRHVFGGPVDCGCGNSELIWVLARLQCAQCGGPAKPYKGDPDLLFEQDLLTTLPHPPDA